MAFAFARVSASASTLLRWPGGLLRWAMPLFARLRVRLLLMHLFGWSLSLGLWMRLLLLNALARGLWLRSLLNHWLSDGPLFSATSLRCSLGLRRGLSALHGGLTVCLSARFYLLLGRRALLLLRSDSLLALGLSLRLLLLSCAHALGLGLLLLGLLL